MNLFDSHIENVTFMIRDLEVVVLNFGPKRSVLFQKALDDIGELLTLLGSGYIKNVSRRSWPVM